MNALLSTSRAVQLSSRQTQSIGRVASCSAQASRQLAAPLASSPFPARPFSSARMQRQQSSAPSVQCSAAAASGSKTSDQFQKLDGVKVLLRLTFDVHVHAAPQRAAA